MNYTTQELNHNWLVNTHLIELILLQIARLPNSN